MRRKNIILATLIGMIGLGVYFITVPSVDEDGLVQVEVEAGDEQVLEDLSFYGSMDNYSEFYFDEEGVKTTASLSYLENLDAPYRMELFNLQQRYPDLVNPGLYDQNISTTTLSEGDDYVLSAHLVYNEHNYYIDENHVYLHHLNKETNEIEEDVIIREGESESNYMNIAGIYEDYPTVKILYATGSWSDNQGMNPPEFILSLGEFNLETKDYSEERLLTEEQDFYDYRSTVVFDNQEKQLIASYDPEALTDQLHVVDYATNEIEFLDTEGKDYTVGDDNQLYSLEFTEEESILKQYDGISEEVTHEVALGQPISQKLYGEESALFIEVVDNQLYTVQNPATSELADGVSPADFLVFDLETGDVRLDAKIHFDEKDKIGLYHAGIHTINQQK